MATFFEEFKHLKIQLEDIKLATNNFSDNNLLGKGGFGNVYKGSIFHSKGEEIVAFKRLDSRYGQGNSEFWREIMMLSRYTHKNLISLLGYCDEGGEKILVYELASRSSLDNYLSDPTLMWKQRLKICLASAKGLDYLHDPKGLHERVLHRDIKSSNILLDENWNPKISDLGLSKMGPANQLHTVLITNIVGTLGYLDPQYLEMGMLTKESDVYSFGVVLFEVLCGKLCFGNKNGQFQNSVRVWKKSYKNKKLDEIIFQDIKQLMDTGSLKTFSDIAYQCVQLNREERPPMSLVVEKLESALKLQEIYESRISTIASSSGSGNEDEQYMKDTLAAAHLQAAFREQLFISRIKEVEFSDTEDEARNIIAAMRIQRAFRKHESRRKQTEAAVRIQYMFHTWKIREDFLNKCRQVFKIQKMLRTRLK